MQGKLALMPAIQRLMDEVMAGPSLKEEREGPLAAEFDLLAAAKKTFLFAAGCATQRFAAKLGDEQEVMAALADMIAQIYVLESTVLRASKIGSVTTGVSVALARLYAARSFEVVEVAARRVIAASGKGDGLRTQMTILRRLTKHEPADTVALGREIAGHMVRTGRYAV